MTKKIKQIITHVMLGLVLLLPVIQPLQVMADNPYDAPAKAAIAIDPDSGKILYAKNVDEPLGIASTTKLITAYMTLDAIKKGTLHWDDKVEMSEYAYALTQNPQASNIAVKDPTEAFSIRDLFNAAMIQSASSIPWRSPTTTSRPTPAPR